MAYERAAVVLCKCKKDKSGHRVSLFSYSPERRPTRRKLVRIGHTLEETASARRVEFLSAMCYIWSGEGREKVGWRIKQGKFSVSSRLARPYSELSISATILNFSHSPSWSFSLKLNALLCLAECTHGSACWYRQAM